MSRMAILKARLLAIHLCMWLLLDLIGNFILSFVLVFWAVATKQQGAAPSPYETMSARAGRGMLNRKLLALWLGWCIDRVFELFQPPYADMPDSRRFTHPSHCVRAFIKTRDHAGLPSEYSRPLPQSLLDCYGPKP